MKEILALDEKIVALPEGTLPEEGIDVSRNERAEAIETLPEEIRAGIDALQRALNEVVPEPFDYFVFLGGDEEASFSIQYEQMPAAGSIGGDFDAGRSIVEQVRELDWEQQREMALAQRGQLNEIVSMLDRLERLESPLPSAKKWQREFREEIKDFVKEKRRDAGKIHVLVWHEDDGLREGEHADGEAFRTALPDVILAGGEALSVVAFGKPLPVERIDALKTEAQQRARERLKRAAETEDDAVREVESEVMTGGQGEPPAVEPSSAGEEGSGETGDREGTA